MYNDLHSRGWKRIVVAVGTTNAILPAGTRIHALLCQSAAAATALLQIYNAATVTGTDIITISSVTALGCTHASLGPNGTVMAIGVTAVLTGTGTTAQIFYSEN